MTRKLLGAPWAVSFLGAAASGAQQPAAPAPSSLTGEWELTIVTFGNSRSSRMNLRAEKAKLTGSVRRRAKSVAITGSVSGK
jgi:hypothetical protein